ncbi:MAG: carboxypeptidase-like regulatory domain-containing protein [Bacteroidales bacterium]|nr:carboxypeptidase-like regulatory domain-containing protein [Bacteroidales bacterium]
MKRTISISALLLLTFNAMAAHLSGRVFLRDTVLTAGDYVMVYCQSCGTGTLSDENGNYSIDLPDSHENIRLEFSRIGYTTVYREIAASESGIKIEDVIMEPQPMMLTAAYVIPDDMEPGEFVLSKVWEQSRMNSKKHMNYSAEISYDMATHDIPIVAQMVPKGMLGLAKFAVAMKGYGPLLKYCLENDDFSATVSLRRDVTKGKAKDSGHTLVRSDSELPKNVQKDVMSIFGMLDLFDLIYGETTNWGEKFSSKNRFELVGTYEYGDKLVDVLEWSNPKMKLKATVHVVEEDWGILKVQMYTAEGEVMRCEARNTGNGVYMPVSFILKPSVTMIRAEQIPELIEVIRNDANIKKNLKEKSIKVLEEHTGQDFNPYVSFSFNIRYLP